MCTCVIDRAQGGASPNETEGGSLFTVLVSSGTTAPVSSSIHAGKMVEVKQCSINSAPLYN